MKFRKKNKPQQIFLGFPILFDGQEQTGLLLESREQMAPIPHEFEHD